MGRSSRRTIAAKSALAQGKAILFGQIRTKNPSMKKSFLQSMHQSGVGSARLGV
jgi:hypothetical protein